MHLWAPLVGDLRWEWQCHVTIT
eukprot:COSAG01_NODE_6067_length_3872_cov_3.959449_1_plen_22_part_10